MKLAELKNLASILRRSLVDPRSFLFGSQLPRMRHLNSDVDLEEVSPSMHRLAGYERGQLIEQALAKLNWRSEVNINGMENGRFPARDAQSWLAHPDQCRRLIDVLGRGIGQQDASAA
ncbi:MAG: hypothetical protein RMJ35_13645 [Phycisphaerales bacterium]|nr:hypothetical protein [Phycisphaerales bacterium]